MSNDQCRRMEVPYTQIAIGRPNLSRPGGPEWPCLSATSEGERGAQVNSAGHQTAYKPYHRMAAGRATERPRTL